MPAFNHEALSSALGLAGVVARLNARFQALAGFLKGIRRDGNGRTVFAQGIEIEEDGGGIILRTPDGTKRYRITVSNAGAVTSTLV